MALTGIQASVMAEGGSVVVRPCEGQGPRTRTDEGRIRGAQAGRKEDGGCHVFPTIICLV